ncbi:MAG: hypothetical protein ACI4PC_05660 [Oscillospiraceae bacterium]
MKKPDLERLAPPGMSLKQEKGFFWGGLAGAWLCSLSFLARYLDARGELYFYVGTQRRLDPNAVMPDFAVLFDGSLLGFALVAACMLFFIVFHYAYYRQGSKSVYLMRRLPQRWEMHKRSLTLPLLAVCLYALAALLVLLAYLAVYLLFTPDECLTPHQWQKIWSVLL